MEKIRLSKLMSLRGLCSRREADAWIERGMVKVDGQTIAVLGTRVDSASLITIDRSALRDQRTLVTVLLNKPTGYVSGQPEGRYPTASDLITNENRNRQDRSPLRYRPQHRHGLAPAGRLDIDSHGLLVLTQDGRIARQLISPDATIEKEYLVRVDSRINETAIQRLRHGLMLDQRQLKPAKVHPLKPNLLKMILVEGRKRQIRRMCELLGFKVIGLKRVRIGNIRLGRLPQGQWRYLGRNEAF